LQAIDLEFINWCGMAHLPICLIFTKMDKLRPNERKRNVARLKNSLLQHWESLPPLFLSSSETAEGKDEIVGYIEQLVEKVSS
jgi:GTP-binding protein